MSREDDLRDVLREERSRGRKRPVDTAAERDQREREAAVLEIYRHGTENDLRELLRIWDFSVEEIEAKVSAFRKVRAGRS
ncbi:MAG: hypothetical protein M3P27_04975 [Acidobacteriota bacterium]|nr:hypothetical protein [Acidobacteriota bacterium]